MSNSPLNYRAAGLDLDVYEQGLAAIAPLVRRTHSPRVLDGFGGFASLFSLDSDSRRFATNYRRPVLISSCDGVGTKLKVASMARRHDTVGIDLVAMSVNDCLCLGGEPLFFLDYVALPRDHPPLLQEIVEGIAAGCQQAGCALVGGETAILPDTYGPEDYDLAGFCVAVAEKDRLIRGDRIEVGDRILGLASSGLHSNGYSLARKIVFDHAGHQIGDFIPELGDTVANVLLTPTRIYVPAVLAALRASTADQPIHGLAHITGGGLVDNLPRILPPGKRALLRRGSWPIPPVFTWLRRLGQLDQAEMDRVFNQGVGLVLVVEAGAAAKIADLLAAAGETVWPLGEIVAGEAAVQWAEQPTA